MIESISKISPRPIMFVAGGTPRPMLGSEGEYMQKMFSHAGENAEMWIIPEASHCDGPAARPEEYSRKMLEFFDSAFGITR